MINANSWKSSTALVVLLGMMAGAATPMVMLAPASAQTVFPDVPTGYWAEGFIRELSSRGVIVGFKEDGTFRPNEPVTRAQFASMVQRAFPNVTRLRPAVNFVDVPANYWGFQQIQYAYTTGFLAGYPGSVFRPNENIPRAQVLVSLTSGLNYAATGPVDPLLSNNYSDAATIPGYARNSIAAATERRLVVNYPDVRFLNPNQQATRAEVAAFIYQALVSTNQVAAIPSPYIVGGQPPVTALRIPAGTTIPVRSGGSEVVLRPNTPVPTTLTVAQNIVSSDGTVLIPAGSQVVGQLQPVQGGAQFVASELVLTSGRRLPLSASANPATDTTGGRRTPSTTSIITGTIVGAGAGAGIGAVTGDREIKAEEVLAGAGVGALAGWLLGGERVSALVLRPNTDLQLQLTSDLVLR